MSDNKSPPSGSPGRPDAQVPDSPAWVNRARPASRHGAIARRLFTYTNYKNWADKVRGSWDEPPAPPPRDPRR